MSKTTTTLDKLTNAELYAYARTFSAENARESIFAYIINELMFRLDEVRAPEAGRGFPDAQPKPDGKRLKREQVVKAICMTLVSKEYPRQDACARTCLLCADAADAVIALQNP